MPKETMRLHIPDMPKELHLSLKMEALRQDMTLKRLVVKVLKAYMKDKT
jgi:hypothetical protein